MKIIYIAGPYFGDGKKETIEKNIREAEKYQIELANHGIGFFCSHNHTEHFQEKAKATEEFYYELDFHFLKKCTDAVLALPGWKNSKGARKEIEWANQNNLKVFYPQSCSDLQELYNWVKDNK